MKQFTLPAYPATEDVWQTLSRERRPLVVYGMGNGADKLLLQMEKRGLTVADFMASDGFVRGHSFHGRRVLSLKEVEEKYEDFIVQYVDFSWYLCFQYLRSGVPAAHQK